MHASYSTIVHPRHPRSEAVSDSCLDLVAEFWAFNSSLRADAPTHEQTAWIDGLNVLADKLAEAKPETMAGCIALLALIRDEMRHYLRADYHADILANCVEFLEAGI